MTCFGDREKGSVSPEETWDNVMLDDFKSESCLSPFSYFLVYVFLLVSLAVYAVDTFTAVNLLAFSRWAGSIEPAIPFKVSRWIFAVCIIISFVLLVIRWLHAIRAMRSGSIAQSYLDPLAARIQSIRMGRNGRGWRRFLVFAELTKSKKGAEYVALFAYFAFESWMNTIFADGPRQVVNAITLYSVMRMDLLPGGEHSVTNDSPAFVQFFQNVKILAEDNNQRTLVLCGMLFTLVVWVLSILKLAIAVILYLIFLFHHIPAEDGSLRAYCRRKINTRLVRVVNRKINKAFAQKAGFNRTPTQPNLGLDRKPTLPLVVDLNSDDKAPAATILSRPATQTIPLPYPSRPATTAPDRKPTLPDLPWTEQAVLNRTVTQPSAYSESTSLSGSTAVSAYSPLDRQTSPAPPVPPLPGSVPMPGWPPTRPTLTPAPTVHAPGRMTPMTRVDYENGPSRYPDPYSTDAPYNGPYVTPYQSYAPAPDPYSHASTPGVSASSGEDYPFSPQSHTRTPHPPDSQSGYRSFTPGNPGRARPQLAFNTTGDYSPRTFSPVSQRETPRPQSPQHGGYVTYEPSIMNTSPPTAGVRPSNSPVYQAYGGGSAASPNDSGRPVRAYTPRGYAQPRPYQNYV